MHIYAAFEKMIYYNAATVKDKAHSIKLLQFLFGEV